MNRLTFLAPVLLSLTPLGAGQTAEPPPPPPPVAQAMPRAATPGIQMGQNSQRVYGPSSDTLIARSTAEGIIEGFRKSIKTDGAPRVVIYVNRALVDTTAGLKLVARTEQFDQTEGALKTKGANSYTVKSPAKPTLADQQTVREIERLFGRAFRHAGAQLADQAVAASLLPEPPGAHLVGDQAAKDREALSKIADVAIEVLISSRSITVPEVAGDTTYPVPDIQATAIRLKDAVIIGQAAASDVVGRGTQAGRVVSQFSVQDITEATALALMEDMLTGKR